MPHKSCHIEEENTFVLIFLLLEFCKQLVTEGKYDECDFELSSPELSEDENEESFHSSAKHPFAVRDRPILMNIRVRFDLFNRLGCARIVPSVGGDTNGNERIWYLNM